MGEYASITDAELARILAADGWKPQDETTCREGFVVLWKDGGNHRPVPLTLPFPIGKNRVAKICGKAGINADRFSDLYVNSIEPPWLAAEPPDDSASESNPLKS